MRIILSENKMRNHTQYRIQITRTEYAILRYTNLNYASLYYLKRFVINSVFIFILYTYIFFFCPFYFGINFLIFLNDQELERELLPVHAQSFDRIGFSLYKLPS